MAKSEFTLAFNEITEVHHLPREIVVDALRQALVSAYRRDSTVIQSQRVEAEVDPITNRYRILVEKEVVDSITNKQTEILFEEARELEPNVQLGDMVMAPVEANTKSFGRIAAQTAKQVILQKIREAERRSMFDEFKDREGDLVTGQVQSVTGQSVTLSLGRAEAVMPYSQQIRGERYRPHDKVRTLILEVKESSRGPQIIVSRAHRNMLRRLLEYEVPEIYNGQVEIKSIAREPGHRSKVAVAALQPGVDPVGACVGMRGIRIQNIVKELSDEKIDVIEWSTDASVFIAKALSPARVTGVYLEDDIDQGNTATVIVPDDQLSLAIGREGQNARLAAKLTGWRIDIKSGSEAAFTAQSQLGEPPLNKLAQDQPDLIVEVARILEKKRADRTVMPEEYHTLTRFVQLAEQRLLEAREINRAKRRKILEKARASTPKRAFTMELEELELEKDVLTALRSKNINNVGDLMMRLSAEPDNVRAILETVNAADDMEAIQLAIQSLVLEQTEELGMEDTPVAEVAESVAEMLTPAVEIPAVAAEAVAPVEETEEAPPAFVDKEGPRVVEPPVVEKRPARVARPAAPAPKFEPPVAPKEVAAEPASFETFNEDDDAEGSEKDAGDRKKGKKGKRQQRELVFDEDRGEVIARRKRKGNRNREWGDFDE